MNATVYILGILLQFVAGVLALIQVRHAPRRLPWLLIALSSLLIVARRTATLSQFMRAGRELALAEVITLLISLLFLMGVVMMARMFRDAVKGHVALQQSETKLRAASIYARNLIETSLDPLVTISAEGQITDANAAAEKITGVSREKLIGTAFPDCFTEPEMARAGYKQVLEQGQVINYPLAIRHVSGTITDVLYNASVYQNEQGEVLGVVAAARDITERKRTEERLAESRQLLEGVLKLTPMMAVYLDAAFNFVWVNPAYAATCKHDPSFFPGRNHFDLYPDAANQAIFQRVVDAGVPFFVTAKPFQFPDQPERGVTYWDWSLIPVTDTDGKVNGLVFTLADVTERIRAEEALRESEERFKSAFQYSPIGMALVSPEGKWLKVNASVCSILGYSEDELAARTFQDITHPDDLDIDLSYVRQMLAGEIKTYTMEKRYFHKDGHLVRVLLAVGLVKDRTGGPLYFISQIEDITERKRAEEELTRYREHLEELVKQRTQEMDAAREQARHADRLASIGTFAAGIAHEINNPLGMMLLSIDSALASLDQPEVVARLLSKNKIDIERCARVVRDVLDFSRRHSTAKRGLDLNEVVRHGVDFTREYSAKHGVTVETRLASMLSPISGNVVELGQVVVNLIHNAVHACEERGHVTIETQETADKVRLVVRDDGSGMTPEQMQHIFDPFYTTRLDKGGTGLGLSIVHGIVTSHEGTIAVASEAGRGTIFTVEFGRYTEKEADDSQDTGR
jgi:PAS domain S-box-containing protein